MYKRNHLKGLFTKSISYIYIRGTVSSSGIWFALSVLNLSIPSPVKMVTETKTDVSTTKGWFMWHAELVFGNAEDLRAFVTAGVVLSNTKIGGENSEARLSSTAKIMDCISIL